MRIGRKFSLAAGAVLAMAVVLLSSYSVGAVVTAGKFIGDYRTPYTKGHADAAADVVSNGQCVLCHRTSIPGSALRGGRSAHQIHLASLFVTFGRMTDPETGAKNGCVTCHTDTNSSNYLRVTGTATNTPMSYEGDVSYAGATPDTTSKLRRHVDPEFCNRCHGKFITGDPTGHGGVVPTGCRNCHGGVSHGSYDWVNQAFANGSQPDARCLRCHGARQWYQTEETNGAAADAATP